MQPIYEEARGDLFLTTDPHKQDAKAIAALLNRSRWAKARPLEIVERSVRNSLTLSILDGGDLVACARLITDWATFAYLCDVFVEEAHRGRGLSRWLVEALLKHPGLESIRRWSLLTLEAPWLYRKFGFEVLENPNYYMELFDDRDSRSPTTR